MAIVQADASSSAVTATSTVNNAGTALNAGTSASSIDNLALGKSFTGGVFASTPVDDADADKALSGGTFAFNGGSGCIQRVTETLAGVSKPFLVNAADDTVHSSSIARQEQVSTVRVTTAIRAGNFNPFGVADQRSNFSSAPTAAVDAFWSIAASGGNGGFQVGSSDTAATPTRSAPGEFSFMYGNPVPDSKDYSAKNT
tara:strand:- start:355 stop:951 length:597 start_codon:yes stop_codon:yes gene_type:complete